jgi:hypothetical protein
VENKREKERAKFAPFHNLSRASRSNDRTFSILRGGILLLTNLFNINTQIQHRTRTLFGYGFSISKLHHAGYEMCPAFKHPWHYTEISPNLRMPYVNYLTTPSLNPICLAFCFAWTKQFCIKALAGPNQILVKYR